MPSLGNRGLASHLIGRGVLDAAVRVLAARSIDVMPLKGIWLQQFVYADPSERRITDVDVLVPEGQYEAALTALRDAGWQRCGGNIAETAFLAPDWPLPLDLHAALFGHDAFRMPARELFARGHADEDAFGVRVTLPDPLDVFAHLVGHFVKSRGGRDSEARVLRDFPAFLERYPNSPSHTAEHLERCGMARTSRYALRCVPSELDRNATCRAVLAALAPDPLGSACAAAMLALRRRATQQSKAAVLPGFVLEASLARGVRSALLRAVERAKTLRSASANSP